jgi:hypothetical protein
MISIEVDKIGSATTPIDASHKMAITSSIAVARAGDVVVVRALSESVTYGNLELPSGRLAKINKGDHLLGVLGRRRALKGFVGEVPDSVKAGDRLSLLNMGGVIGVCSGHHSSFSDAIDLEVLGAACTKDGQVINIADQALKPEYILTRSAPIIMIAGSCMNSGKTVAATELIKQASRAGLKVAGAKLSGIACLRDTLNMEDHGAFITASFLDCGLPSTAAFGDLAPVAKAILNHLNSFQPDLIVAELGDGVIGGYSVDTVLKDEEIRDAITSLVFCASDYVGVIGGLTTMNRLGIDIDVVAGSVTDSKMGEDFIESEFGLAAGNARRDGKRLFSLAFHQDGTRSKIEARQEPAFA